MTKRIFGFVILLAATSLLLLAAVLATAGTSAAHEAAPAVIDRGAAALASTPQAAGKAQPQGVWADVAPFPTITISPTPGSYPARIKRANAAAYPPNGKIYMFGGRHGIDGEDSSLTSIYEYTPGNPGTWLRKTAAIDGGQLQGSIYSSNMAVAVLTDANGVRIYTVGGSSVNSQPTPVVRVYDPIADSITILASDPWPAAPVRIPGGYAVVNNKLYIFGGFSALGTGAVYGQTWVFDPLAAAGSKWTQLATANLSVPRGFIAGVALDGFIYAIGGDTWNGTTLVPNTTVERLDPSVGSPTWTTRAALPTARGDMGAWAYDTSTNYEISGRIAIAGGVYPVPDAQGYLYNPGTNSWGVFPNMTHATRNYGTAQLNGFLYALGGYDYTNNLPNGANWNQRYDATTPLGTATSTVTGTPPSATVTLSPTRTFTPLPGTATSTATATLNACQVQNYLIAQSTGATVVPGTTFVGGSNCDDCSNAVTLPFPFQLYGQSFTTVNAVSNGNLQFNSSDTAFSNSCLPWSAANYAILPHWDDLLLTGANQGIYTSISGVAPNRIFNIEWRGGYFSGGGTVDLEVRLYENSPNGQFDVIYGTVTQNGSGATIGVQKDTGSLFTQFSCDTATLSPGLKLTFTLPSCTTGTPGTATATAPAATATRTVTVTATVTVGATNTAPVGTATPLPTVTGQWEDIAPFPVITISPTPGSYPARIKRANAAGYPPNGKVYMFGGRHGIDGEDSSLTAIYEYTPGSPGTWLRKTATIDGGQLQGSIYSSNMAVAVLTDANGVRIYTVGGSSVNSQPTPVVRVYDPVADSITILASDPWPAAPVRIPGGYAVVNNKLYIFGGFSALGTGAVYGQTWVFDPLAAAGSKWTQLASANLSVPRGFIAGVALDGFIYAIGGDTWNGTALVPNTTVERLDPNAGTPAWTTLAPLPTARGDLQAWAYNTGTPYQIAGRVVVDGGVYPTPDNVGYSYNPGTNSWSAFANFIHATRNYGGAQLNGILYAFGGYDYTNNLPNGANWNQRLDVNGTALTATPAPATSTATQTATVQPSPTSSPIATSTVPPVLTATGTVAPTLTVPIAVTNTSTVPPATATATSTVCPVQFQDVAATDPFYPFIRCLACQGIISGYTCGGVGEPCVPPGNRPYFRTNNLITRSQVSKMISLSAGLTAPVPSGQQTFQDVPSSNPFWPFIERLATAGYISGYACGGAGEPCQPPANRPYFRPYANVTRGQLAKIDANAALYNDIIPSTQQTFEDVPFANPFWLYIERVSIHGVISGYNCGGVGEPCNPPGNRPYFRTFASATRGQTAKIVANTFFPNCNTPQARPTKP